MKMFSRWELFIINIIMSNYASGKKSDEQKKPDMATRSKEC